jgi:hypothetical protein
MNRPEDVAALALAYRTCHAKSFFSAASVDDDLATAAGEHSLVVLEASRVFKKVDWRATWMLSQPPYAVRLARLLLARGEGLRAEAILHAIPPNGRRTRKAWAAESTQRQRWDAVRDEMDRLEARGVTASVNDVDDTFRDAYMQLTGKSEDDYVAEMVSGAR